MVKNPENQDRFFLYLKFERYILTLFVGFETQTGSNSTSDSTESLNSNQSNHVTNSSTPSMQDPTRRGYGGGVPRGPGQGPIYSNINVSELGGYDLFELII